MDAAHASTEPCTGGMEAARHLGVEPRHERCGTSGMQGAGRGLLLFTAKPCAAAVGGIAFPWPLDVRTRSPGIPTHVIPQTR